MWSGPRSRWRRTRSRPGRRRAGCTTPSTTSRGSTGRWWFVVGRKGEIQRPHYYLPGNVVDAAIRRMRWIFDEFDNKVVVSTSGGKDSTAILELAALVNNE